VVASACNPNYLGGGDQEDHGSKPVQGKKVNALLYYKLIIPSGIMLV
jgi:hypothetical protein